MRRTGISRSLRLLLHSRIFVTITLFWLGLIVASSFWASPVLAQGTRITYAAIPAQAHAYRAELTRAAHTHWGLDAPIAVFAAQIHQESAWNPQAVSRVGARGMAQFMPATAAWWCDLVKLAPADCQPENPTWAIRSLVGYDRWLYERVAGKSEQDRLAFMLSSYNGGLGWVQRDKRLAARQGRDPLAWFDSVEHVNAGRSRANWQENRHYPRRILVELAPRYASWGQAL